MENNSNENINVTTDDSEIVGNAVAYSILAYIGILWIIGLVASPEKDTAFVKNHVNNGIVLAIIGAITGVVGCIPVLGWIVGVVGCIPVLGWIVGVVVGIATLVFAIMGIVAAAKKQFFTIPIIGDKFQIIK